MASIDLRQDLAANAYPGRGIIMGRSDNGENAVLAYFIMGRSANSRNRVFVRVGQGIMTEAFDPDKMEDPSLIIYHPVRVFEQTTIVTNGDQTDTIFEQMGSDKTFYDALRSRQYEPDAPNFTPRISGVCRVADDAMQYTLSILKRGAEDSCSRQFFEYDEGIPGVGHFIHTYDGDGKPLPSYTGEPKTVQLTGNIDNFTTTLWSHLNEENKVSLFVRYIRLSDGAHKTRIVNKNMR